MGSNAAALVSSAVLAMATVPLLPGSAHAQTRWPGHRYYAYGPTPARADADRKAERPTPRPARISEIVYLNVEGGYQTLFVNTLAAAGSIAGGDIRPVAVSTTAGGPVYGMGGGVRFGFLTLGGRVRGAHLSVGDLSTINGELGARITLHRVEPYFTFAAGYAKLVGSDDRIAGIRDLNIHGWNARAGLGVDYYPDKNFTVGVNVTGDAFAMARPGIDLSTSPEAQARERVNTCRAFTDRAQQEQCASGVIHDTEGSSGGFAATMSLVLGLHF